MLKGNFKSMTGIIPKASLISMCAFMFVGSLAGCGSGNKVDAPAQEQKPATSEAPTEKTGETKKASKAMKIGIVWEGKGSVADKTAESVETQLKKISPETTIEIKKELPSVAELEKTVRKWESEKDGIVVLRSNGVEWIGKNNLKVPVFIGACNRPDGLGITEPEKKKISGTSYYLPKKDQFDTLKTILPKLESVVLLYDKRNASSNIDTQETEAICKQMGIAYEGKGCSSKEEVLAAAEASAGKASVIILGFQSLVYDNTKDIVAKAGKTPVWSYSPSAVKDGAFGCFAADDLKLGTYIADQIVDIVVNGKTYKETTIKYDKTPRLSLNKASVDSLGLKIPQSILASAKIIK